MATRPISPLRLVREQRGLSLEALGRLSDLSMRTVHRTEQGQTKPSDETKAKLAAALGLTIDVLFAQGNGDANRSPGLDLLPRGHSPALAEGAVQEAKVA